MIGTANEGMALGSGETGLDAMGVVDSKKLR